jgi:hypothetical protein
VILGWNYGTNSEERGVAHDDNLRHANSLR